MTEISSFAIRQWADDDRPREKLLERGPATLSDAELLAILIGSGSSKESAVDLAKRVLSHFSGLSALGKSTPSQLLAFKGIGPAKAVTLLAAMEITRRRRNEVPVELDKINSSATVFHLMQPLLGHLGHEEFWILYLNNSNKVINKTQLSKGGITGTVVDVRLLYKNAINYGATGIILCHNHPSGALTPSQADRDITKKIKAAGEHLDIRLLDHLIITENHYYSFADEGLI